MLTFRSHASSDDRLEGVYVPAEIHLPIEIHGPIEISVPAKITTAAEIILDCRHHIALPLVPCLWQFPQQRPDNLAGPGAGNFAAGCDGPAGALASAESGFEVLNTLHPNLATLMRDASPAQSSDCTANSNGETCNIPISYTGACPGGGTIGVSGDLDFTLNNSGDGTDSTSITVTPTNCSVSKLTINGDPNVTVTTQVNIANDQIQFPLTLTEKGAVSYGPNPSGRCSLSVALTISSPSGCTVNGMVCGQPVSGSCSLRSQELGRKN